MECIEIWKSVDGVMFTNEEECREHEVMLSIQWIGDAVRFFDIKKHRCKFNPMDGADYFFVYVDDAGLGQEAFELIEHEGYSTPSSDNVFDGPGLYYYDDSSDRWISYDKELARLKEVKEGLVLIE